MCVYPHIKLHAYTYVFVSPCMNKPKRFDFKTTRMLDVGTLLEC